MFDKGYLKALIDRIPNVKSPEVISFLQNVLNQTSPILSI